MPELAYGASALAQHNTSHVGDIWVHHAQGLDKFVRRLKDIQNYGGARIYVRKLYLHRLVRLTYFDASFAQEVGLKSQGGMLTVLSDQGVTSQHVAGDLQRVFRITMAAESAALSKPRASIDNSTCG